jgi:hypothetical protein
MNNHIKAIARQGRGYNFEVLRARTLFSHAKHKLKQKPFRSGYRQQMDRMSAGVTERTIDYSGVTRDEILNDGAIFPHGFAKSLNKQLNKAHNKYSKKFNRSTRVFLVSSVLIL